MVRTPAGSGGHGNEAPGLTREPEVKWSGPAITSSDSRSGVHDSAAAVLSSVENPPKLRHITSQPCAAWTYVRPRLPSPTRGLIPAITPLRDLRVSDTLSL